MRKQVGFDVISENVGQDGTTKQVLLGRVQRYLDEGWEVLNTHVPQTGAGSITITVVLVKYADTESAPEVVKRGPGRPPKSEDAE